MAKSGKSKSSEERGKTMYTLKISDEHMEKLEDILSARGWQDYEVAYARFAFKGASCNVVGYQSGKLVVQGKGTEDFVRDILESEVTGDPQLGYESVHHPEWFELHAGMDESGKGDCFGSISVATVIADGKAVESWMKAGIQDSKKITDGNIQKLAKIIRKTPGVVVEHMMLSMPKYNELMAKPKANLNLLLAWQHAKALEKALDRKQAPWGMLDQFSKQPLVQRYMNKHTDFDLRMQTKAEADPVVAAASIIARDAYVTQMKELSEATGEPLMKGAGNHVLEQAKRIFQQSGREGLEKVAKMHFRTSYLAQGLEPPEKKVFRKR
ncbi:MAG: ribonuclease HIII [Opitutales bacterium]